MTRYFIALEGELAVLAADIQDEDYEAAGYTPPVEGDPNVDREAAEYAAQRLLAHTGFDVHDAYVVGED